MIDDRSPDEDDADSNPSDDERTERNGFHLEAGLRPLSDLLGSLVDVTVTDAPPPSTDSTPRSEANDDPPGELEDQPDQPADREQTSRPRTVRRRASVPDEYLIDTRREDGEFVVTADLPGVSVDDLSIGIDSRSNRLVIDAADTVLEPVDLPWRSVEATRVQFNNGVLEVRLRPTES